LVASLDRLANDDGLRNDLGENGYRSRHGIWSESEHLERYFALIDEHRRGRRLRIDRPHTLAGPRVRPRGKVRQDATSLGRDLKDSTRSSV
ncbi:hypothetical protein ACYOEI_41515, partial [Singulisphaera rosea]